MKKFNRYAMEKNMIGFIKIEYNFFLRFTLLLHLNSRSLSLLTRLKTKEITHLDKVSPICNINIVLYKKNKKEKTK